MEHNLKWKFLGELDLDFGEVKMQKDDLAWI